MDYQTQLFFSLSSLLILYYLLKDKFITKVVLPPGPKPWPIIGNILQLTENPHRDLTHLSESYGPLITLKLGTVTTIVVSSVAMAREIFENHDLSFSSRTIPYATQVLSHPKYSVALLAVSPKWRNLRKICSVNVFTKKILDATEVLRQEKVKELLDFLKENCGKCQAVEISRVAFTTLLNFLSNSFFSVDLVSQSSKASQELKDVAAAITEGPVYWRHRHHSCNTRMGNVGAATQSRKMAKAQAELDKVVGKIDLVKESDVENLPYLRAVVKETLRLHPATPFLIPRKAVNDVSLCGYKIPKNSQLLVNVWAMGRDPSAWDNPEMFLPERFLESGIDFRGHQFKLLPFGAGRRMCLGLPLAERMLHLILANLLHSFIWKVGDEISEEEDVDMTEAFGLTLHKAKPLLALPIAK